MKKNIVVIYSDKFPNGGAGANRHLTIAKGLVELGNNVEFHLIRPTEGRDDSHKNPVTGQIDGVTFFYTSGTNIWNPRNRLSKLFLIWLGISRSIITLLKKNKDSQVHIVISGFSNLTATFVYHICCKMLGIKFIYHVDEYPWMIIHPEKYNKAYTFIFLRLFYKLFDAIIVINKTLYAYYSAVKLKNAQIIILPMTVDSSRFDKVLQEEKKSFDFVYAGSMSIYKDGVDILINAYVQFKNKIKGSTRLILIGSIKEQTTIEKLKNIVSKNNLEEEVLFIGEKHRDEIPTLLCNANALVLARPSSIQAEGGFPTKLGEYLLTKKPVIITNVGEIKNYLEDNISAYISEPNEVSFSQKMIEVYLEPEKATRVGLKGFDVAMKNFDYKGQIRLLNTNLNDIISDGSISNN